MDRIIFTALVFVWMLTTSAVGVMAILYAPHSPNPSYTTGVVMLLVINVICVLVFIHTAIQLYFRSRE